MKNKVYIVGPPSSGKTTFTHKMMGRDFLLFKDNVVEVTGVPENVDDAIHVYLILPDEEELASRGGSITEEDVERYMEFYHTTPAKITLVKDF